MPKLELYWLTESITIYQELYAPVYDNPEQVLNEPKQNFYYNQPNNWPNNPQHSTSYQYYGPQTNQIATTEKPNNSPTERGVKTRFVGILFICLFMI